MPPYRNAHRAILFWLGVIIVLLLVAAFVAVQTTPIRRHAPFRDGSTGPATRTSPQRTLEAPLPKQARRTPGGGAKPGSGPRNTPPPPPAGPGDAPPDLLAPIPVDAGLADLRRRAAEAQALYAASQANAPGSGAELARRLASESDPRVRFALTHGEVPDLPRPRPDGPKLPAAAARIPAGTSLVYWLSPRGGDGVYLSRIEVADDGRAQVETTYEQTNGPTWTVRYPAWAWRAADGRTVLDARDQEVTLVRVPEGYWWSPDSMLIDQQGKVELIDDHLRPSTGTTETERDG